MQCDICFQTFRTSQSLATHKYKSKLAVESGKPNCLQRLSNKRKRRDQNAQLEQMSMQDIREAVSASSTTETTNALLEDLRDQLGRQNTKMDSLIQKNEDQNNKISELKEMMIDMQNNPRLLMICNNLYPLDQLNLKAPEFKPVLEILDKELPEYANLCNTTTGQIHAKAIKTLNHIQPTAVKEGEDIYFKSENILSKDSDDTTTKAFINAIGKMGYEYAQKASKDLESKRESDTSFQNEILENAKRGALPGIQDITQT